MEKIRIHTFISGSVQGVFFRSYTQEVAEDLGINGWVRNLPDGRVEVIAEGDKDKVKKLEEFLKKGPSGARVDKIDMTIEEYKGEFKNFKILY